NGAVPPSMRESVSNAGAATISGVTLEQVKPSDQFTEVHRSGLSISYPANCSTATAQNSITIAPKAGVSQNAIAYGVIVSTAQDDRASSLDQVAQDLIQNLQQSNPGMRQSGDIRDITINGGDARAVDLASNSPLQQDGNSLPERDWLVVGPGPGGSYLYLIFIAPERDFGALRPTYQRMLDSVRVQ